MERAKARRTYLARNVRVVSTREGVTIASAKGCFRINGQAGLGFVSDVLPILYDVEAGPSPDWLSELCHKLEPADIVQFTSPIITGSGAHDQEMGVAVIRQTPLMGRVANELSARGIRLDQSAADGAFALMDLSGLDTETSRQLLRAVDGSGCRSMSVWKRGVETFYGPWVEPHTACWNCCRLRFSDSISGEDGAIVKDDPHTALVIAENVLIAVRYPAVAAYGCVLVEDSRMSTLHFVVPMPWCDVCGGAAEATVRGDAPLTQSLLVPDELRILADPRGGILKKLFIFDGGLESPAVPSCCSAVIGVYQEGGVSRAGFNGEGKGATKEAAVWSAIGEGIERYAASLWDASVLIHASFHELGEQAFDPRWLVLYDEEQYARKEFPFAPFDPVTPMYWTSGHWLDTGEKVWIPALATYMHFPARASERFGQTTSNGLAVGATFEDAALRALYELIERDAFMLFWLARRPALRLAEYGCDAVTHRALREVERLGARTELYVIDTGTQHPTVVCLGLGDGRSWPGATIGLGTHADPDIALQRAVLEHGHCGPYIRRLMREGRHDNILTSEDVLTGLDHSLYYVQPVRAAALDPFRSDTEAPASLADLRSTFRQDATLTNCVARLRDAGIRAAAVDVTSPDVALAPVRVVRAFGTYMQPIHFGTANRRLKNPRLERLLLTGVETNPHPIS